MTQVASAHQESESIQLPMVGEIERLVRARGSMFLVTNRQGDIAPAGARELGLFYQDTRFLSHYELEIRDGQTVRLSAETSHSAFNQVERASWRSSSILLPTSRMSSRYAAYGVPSAV